MENIETATRNTAKNKYAGVLGQKTENLEKTGKYGIVAASYTPLNPLILL